MSSSLSTHLASMETSLEGADSDLEIAKNMFDFDNIGDSRIEARYNYIVNSDEVLEDETSGNVWRLATIRITFSYNVARGNFTNTIEKSKVTLAETYMSALYTTFCSYTMGISYFFDEGDIDDKVIYLVMDFSLKYRLEVTT